MGDNLQGVTTEIKGGALDVAPCPVVQCAINANGDPIPVMGNSLGTPSSFDIQTANGDVFTLVAGERGVIQNLGTTGLAVKYGTGASTSSLSFVLPGGDANDDGKGAAVIIEFVGIVSVAAISGTARFVAWKQG